MKIGFLRGTAWMLLTLLLLGGCANRAVESDLGLRGVPDWVNRGSQALNDRQGRYIHGVAHAPLMTDESLQSEVADNRARAEVARVLSTYMDIALRDFVAEAGTGQSAISRQIDALTRINLSGARIIARWRDQRTGALYSLAELDMERVKSMTGAAAEMNSELREHFARRGDNIFDAMVKGER